MSAEIPDGLPEFDRSLLRIVARLVPTCDREEWTRAWQAELWHMHNPRCLSRRPRLRGTADLAAGVVLDGLWLRAEDWRRAFRGTALLCLAILLSLNVFFGAVLLIIKGVVPSGWASLECEFRHCLVAAPLVLLVALATNSRRHIEQGPRRGFRLKRWFFFFAQIVQVLLLAFLLSAILCLPIHESFPNTSDLLQVLCFVCFALLHLRWAVRDQEQRCKHCLCSLTQPARVGRPSHNLLEWNGTALTCRYGHGHLSIPEIETSWCQSSEWTELDIA